MFVIPTDGLAIIDPVRRDVLPPEGRNVNDDHPYYWDRHRQDGSVQILTKPEEIKSAEAKLEKADAKRADDIRKAQEAANADEAKKSPEAAPKAPAQK